MKALAIVLVAVAASGCAGPYLGDRARDAADVVTVGVGLGIGAKARVGPVQTGLLLDQPYAALRGGEWVDQSGPQSRAPFSQHPLFPVRDYDTQLVFCGWEQFYAVGHPYEPERFRHKAYAAEAVFPVPFFHPVDDPEVGAHYYTQLEVVVGLGPSVRLGVNPAELVDFVLGWVGVDLLEDDIGHRLERPSRRSHMRTMGMAEELRRAVEEERRRSRAEDDRRYAEDVWHRRGGR